MYWLRILALILPIAITNMEMIFYFMNHIKNKLCNGMNDRKINYNLLTYIEKNLLKTILIYTILMCFNLFGLNLSPPPKKITDYVYT